MKLEMSLPERPGWIFVIPGFDFVALLLALVMLTGVVAKESFVDVKLPRSEFRGVRLGDENPVVVTLKSGVQGPVYHVGGEETPAGELGEAILKSTEERQTRAVAIKVDQSASMAERQVLINAITRLRSLRILEGYRREDKR